MPDSRCDNSNGGNHPQQIHCIQQSMPSPKHARHGSLTAPPPPVSPMPQSPQEWKGVMDEVKRKYLERKYRSCSMQCCEIVASLHLDSSGIRETTFAVEPLHLIYLHFYAASSFEWCARPLSSSSTYRTKLLRDAQMHYAEAEGHIRAAECALTEKVLSPFAACGTYTSMVTMNRCASPRPSFCSPGLSASPHTSASTTISSSMSRSSSSPASSPRTSVSSLGDAIHLILGPGTGAGTGMGAWADPLGGEEMMVMKRGRTKNPNKKVSFSSLPEFFEFVPEPHIRPDSPTLGWPETDQNEMGFSKIITNAHSMSGMNSCNDSSYPSPLLRDGSIRSPFEDEEAARGGGYVCDSSNERCSMPSSHVFDLETFIQTRSINRLCTRLSALRDQVRRHRSAVDNLLAPSEADGGPSTPQKVPQTPVSNSSFSYTGGRRNNIAGEPFPSPPTSAPTSSRTPTFTATIAQNPRTDTLSRPILRLKTDLDSSPTTPSNHYVPQSTLPCTNITSPISPLTLPLSAFPATTKDIGKGKEGRDPRLQERIERLRASGWCRRRFDSRRYEVLREQALGELEAGPGMAFY